MFDLAIMLSVFGFLCVVGLATDANPSRASRRWVAAIRRAL